MVVSHESDADVDPFRVLRQVRALIPEAFHNVEVFGVSGHGWCAVDVVHVANEVKVSLVFIDPLRPPSSMSWMIAAAAMLDFDPLCDFVTRFASGRLKEWGLHLREISNPRMDGAVAMPPRNKRCFHGYLALPFTPVHVTGGATVLLTERGDPIDDLPEGPRFRRVDGEGWTMDGDWGKDPRLRDVISGLAFAIAPQKPDGTLDFRTVLARHVFDNMAAHICACAPSGDDGDCLGTEDEQKKSK